jgi:ubiquinone/menaquinone biosynthesis C-methylase UbiE
MPSAVFFEIHRNLPQEGPGRDEYTRKAFRLLPPMKQPEILDVGCGPGTPTMELARLTDGQITAIDIHQPYLDRLTRRSAEAGLSDRIKTMNISMFEMDFPPESFDIIWAEGFINLLGFEQGLRAWRRFLKEEGFLVVHDVAWIQPDPPGEAIEYWSRMYPDMRSVAERLETIADCGYKLVGQFVLPEDAWWKEYYGPLEARLQELSLKYKGDAEALREIRQEQREVEMYRRYSRWYGTVFLTMKNHSKRHVD